MYKQCGHIAVTLYHHFLTSGSRPDLSELIQLRGKWRDINVPWEVGRHYYEFGDKLLEGHMAQVQHIIPMYREDPECINLHILQEWLEGKGRKPVTWGTLVETLQCIGLRELARDIRDVKTTTGTADEPPPTPAPGMMSMCCVGTCTCACVLVGCFSHVHTCIYCTCTVQFDFCLLCLPVSSASQETTTGTTDKPSPTPAPGMMGRFCVSTCVWIGCIGCVHVHVHTYSVLAL